MIGLPRLTDGNEVLLVFLVLIAAGGIFILVKAAIGAVLSRSWTRRTAVLGAAVLLANLASAAIGMAGLDRATLQ